MLSFGCSGNSEKKESAKKDGSEEKKSAENKTETKTIDYEIVKNSDFSSKVAEQKGKVVVVDLWATWCPPCIKKYPTFLKTFGGKEGVVAFSLAMEENMEEETKARVKDLLTKFKSTIPNYYANPEEKWTDVFGFDGGLPAVLVYNQEGKLAKLFSSDVSAEPFTYEDVSAFIEKLQTK